MMSNLNGLKCCKCGRMKAEGSRRDENGLHYFCINCYPEFLNICAGDVVWEGDVKITRFE